MRTVCIPAFNLRLALKLLSFALVPTKFVWSAFEDASHLQGKSRKLALINRSAGSGYARVFEHLFASQPLLWVRHLHAQRHT